ncbi:FAD-dependent oxidoreductase [Sphingomonas sp. LHG3406-1]|uniref:FAD-dependent oxidoreductase n=1 Tax=Sphingomonas sp. LHG3406-1 TaxID=2804617 RepID=UPI00262FEBAE|nr:bifunctional TVP38/TMEM64 family protein/FAD-dependent oxidoreductase [Sphingomonas sp. LHG3406-1]
MSRALAGRLGLLALLAAGIAAFFLLDLGSYLTLDALKAQQAGLATLLAERPVLVIGGFFLLYVAATALSLPGAVILTLAAGAIFGLWLGTLIVSFASAIGASFAFLSSRYVLRDWVRSRFGKRVAAIDRGIVEDGAFYLLTLRLIPAFPFFLINLAMGLTAMRLPVFTLVSQIGMLPGTFVYVNAGTQLAAIERTSDVLSPALIGSLVLLGIFPLVAKWLLGLLKRRRLYRGWTRPKRFDRNLVVIGAGAGGLVTAYIAATVRAKVTLIEAHKMGGDCLNTGCVPSKALIRSARAAHDMRRAAEFGIAPVEPRVDFPAIMQRIRDVITTIEPADSVERYTGLGVDVRLGHATIVDPWTVEIAETGGGTTRLTTRAIVIAAGGEPFLPDIPGLREAGALTSDTLWEALARRGTLPERMVIVGGGPIGTELAQSFARLGSAVTLVEAGPRILPKDDADAADLILATLRQEGVTVLLGHKALRCEGRSLVVASDAGETILPFDEIIVAVGRRARLTGYGLESLGIDTGKPLALNDKLQTIFPNIYAAGDVAGAYQFTHYAAHQAWYAAVNALFGTFRSFSLDNRVIPWTTFTEPEVAHVGHTEATAREAGVAYEIVRYDLGHLDRAVAEGARSGFVKLLVQPGKDRIIGATIVAAGAGEMLAEYVLAMKQGIGLNKVLGTIHAYPTMTEANKYAAGEWKKAHKPERLLAWVERFHDWRRGGR